MMNATRSATPINSGTILLGFAAVVVGLAGTYGIRVISQKPPITAQPPAEKAKPVLTTVPLASREIASGTELTLDDVALFKMTSEEVKSRFPGVAFMTNPSQIIGKIALNDIRSGAPFNTKDFFPAKKGPGVVSRLKPGLRALTIVLKKTDALIGFAGPGQRVDVLFNYGTGSDLASGAMGSNGKPFFDHHLYNPPRLRDYWGNTVGSGGAGGAGLKEAGLEGATTTLVQNVEILALGHQSAPTDAATALPELEQVEVTLAVSPRQAELLRVADLHGELSLTLRGATDDEQLALVAPVTLDMIIDAKKQVHEMEVYRGSKVSHLQFRGDTIIERRTFGQDAIVNNVPTSDQQPVAAQSGMPPMPTFVPVLVPPSLMKELEEKASMQTVPVQSPAKEPRKSAP